MPPVVLVVVNILLLFKTGKQALDLLLLNLLMEDVLLPTVKVHMLPK